MKEISHESLDGAILAARVCPCERETDRADLVGRLHHRRPQAHAPSDNAMPNRSNQKLWTVARLTRVGQPVGWQTARTKS